MIKCISHWNPAASGVQQGSVLRPSLFVIYFDNLEVNAGSMVGKSVDNTCRKSQENVLLS